MSPLKEAFSRPRGMTLVELMIVVAVVGILAGIGGVAYMKHIKTAKTAKLKQYAMEVASAQEQFKSQGSNYLDLSGTEYAEDNKRWEKVLGFSKRGLSDDIGIETEAGAGGETCDLCTDNGMNESIERIWYAVEVTQNMDGDSSTGPTTVLMTSELESPMILNEGE